ncbi:hypothetical protein GCM10022255_107960 [Dactylosporangium darangshiense]|uniref:Uncharacterized protein n=1 Tax=Dactylosporangium darangshiense TaxID=579108 RepID=A0ABP8DTU5_9ACTN
MVAEGVVTVADGLNRAVFVTAAGLAPGCRPRRHCVSTQHNACQVLRRSATCPETAKKIQQQKTMRESDWASLQTIFLT